MRFFPHSRWLVVAIAFAFSGYGQTPAPRLQTAAAPAPVSRVADSLDCEKTSRQIRAATIEELSAVLVQIEADIKTTTYSLEAARRAGRELKDDARARFAAAYDQLRVREEDLLSRVRDVRASGEKVTEDARTQLALSYAAYAQAVATVESAAVPDDSEPPVNP